MTHPWRAYSYSHIFSVGSVQPTADVDLVRVLLPQVLEAEVDLAVSETSGHHAVVRRNNWNYVTPLVSAGFQRRTQDLVQGICSLLERVGEIRPLTSSFD